MTRKAAIWAAGLVVAAVATPQAWGEAYRCRGLDRVNTLEFRVDLDAELGIFTDHTPGGLISSPYLSVTNFRAECFGPRDKPERKILCKFQILSNKPSETQPVRSMWDLRVYLDRPLDPPKAGQFRGVATVHRRRGHASEDPIEVACESIAGLAINNSGTPDSRQKSPTKSGPADSPPKSSQ